MWSQGEAHALEEHRIPDTAQLAAIEQASLWAWPPRETRYLHGWLLRAGGAGSRRLSSARTLAFDDGARLDRAIAETEAWYASRGLPATFQLTDRAMPAGLDDELHARGYEAVTPALVMTAALRPGAAPQGVELLHRPSQAVLNAMADPLWTDALRRERAALLARIRRPHRLGLVTVGGLPAAGGLVVLDGELAGLFALRTAVPFRRQGLGRRLIQALMAWACHQGAGLAYLQVEEANGPARALYAALGFTPAYRYWYRVAPGS